MTADEYQDFKLRVLAKTTGANVHRISGMLGVLINSIVLADYWADKNLERYKVNKACAVSAEQEIRAEINI